MTKKGQDRYQNFDVAIYTRVYEVREMADPNYLARFDEMSKHIKVDKIYLETHRDMIVADEATLIAAKKFFADRGVKTSGGITVTVNEANRFETYCYTNPEHRQKLKEVVELTARHFDELILDDFFFTSCKCESCIKAKGDRSWTDFRLELMTEAAQSVVIGPARAVNPKIEVVIKYPNWYEHFQGLGFNLEAEPKMFDRIYSGTETRDAVLSNQHLQPYHGYSIVRYFDNLRPGHNGGGWVDPFGMNSADRYAEQLWMTVFAKAPECTLFDFRSLMRPLTEKDRAPWQAPGNSFDFDKATAGIRQADGSLPETATIPPIAGYAFEKADPVVGMLGKPVGVKNYKPYHSVGEDFLQSYLGMIGIPMDIVPEFPAEEPVILLTETASFDPTIVEKIKKQLVDGKTVVMTSGLWKALQGKGIEDIVELRLTDRKALVREFLIGWGQVYKADKEILVPQMNYLTNDSWEEISGLGPYTGYPLLHSARYANSTLYVLVLPENFSDLYALPAPVLTRIKDTVCAGLPVMLDAPSQVSLFLYDNNTLIVESFRDEPVEVKLVGGEQVKGLCDALSGETLEGTPVLNWRRQETGKKTYPVTVPAHSFRVFQWS